MSSAAGTSAGRQRGNEALPLPAASKGSGTRGAASATSLVVGCSHYRPSAGKPAHGRSRPITAMSDGRNAAIGAAVGDTPQRLGQVRTTGC